MEVCVFWYPRTINVKLKVLKSKTGECKLSDKKGKDGYYANFEFQELKNNIIITVFEKKKKRKWYSLFYKYDKTFKFKFTLNYEFDYGNGFIQYSYDENIKDSKEFENKDFLNFLYHNSKSLFHDHEFHSIEEDSIIVPYCSVDGTAITHSDVLLHYMKEFKSIFELHYEDILLYSKRLDYYLKKSSIDKYAELLIIRFHRIEGFYLYYKNIYNNTRIAGNRNSDIDDLNKEIEHIFEKTKFKTEYQKGRLSNRQDKYSKKISLRSLNIAALSLIIASITLLLSNRFNDWFLYAIKKVIMFFEKTGHW